MTADWFIHRTLRALKKVEMRGTQMAWTKVGWREIQTALMMVDC